MNRITATIFPTAQREGLYRLAQRYAPHLSEKRGEVARTSEAVMPYKRARLDN